MTIWPEPRLLPCGDRALSVELGDEVNRELNARVLALEYLLQQKHLPGVGETKATSILAAATAWVSEHPAPPAESSSEAEDGGGSEIEPSPLEH